jgi:hypothetical protein
MTRKLGQYGYGGVSGMRRGDRFVTMGMTK